MDIDDLADQFDKHEKEDEKRFDALGVLIRAEIGKLVVAISGNETTGGLRAAIEAIKDTVPHNARDRLLTLEQRVPHDLQIVLNNLVQAETARKTAMKLVWSSIASIAVVVFGSIAAMLMKLVVTAGVTP